MLSFLSFPQGIYFFCPDDTLRVAHSSSGFLFDGLGMRMLGVHFAYWCRLLVFPIHDGAAVMMVPPRLVFCHADLDVCGNLTLSELVQQTRVAYNKSHEL